MDITSVKEKLKKLQSNNKPQREKIDYSKIYWKPKEEGKYIIRIVPSKFDKSNPFKEIFVHYGLSKFPAPSLTNWNEKDPIVEFAKKLRESDDVEDFKLSKKIEPKLRVVAPVIVRGEESKGVRLWEFGKEIYMQLLGIAEDEDYGDYTDINEGRDFTVETIFGDVGGRKGLKSSIRIKPKQTPLSDNKDNIKEWLENQPNILDALFKNKYENLKEMLAKYLEPDIDENSDIHSVISEEDDSENSIDSDNDNPWKEEIPVKKQSNSKKFDDLFNDED
jgi:hypothetical protein